MLTTDVQALDIDHSLARVEDWLTEYISRPHPQMGRVGPVCPFVEPSRRSNALETRVRLVGATPSLSLIIEIARCSLEEFGEIKWRSSNPNLHSLLVVMPDFPSYVLHLLDQAHAVVKPEFVRRGVMIGQFHPLCTEKAARNPRFEVSRSPVPLLAIRSMAIHDVFFLAEQKEWFTTYVERFGRYYRHSSNGLDAVLTDAYWKACARHGIQG